MKADKKIITDISANLGFEVNASTVVGSEVSIANEFIPFFNRSIEDESTWKNSETTVRVNFDELNKITSRAGRPRFPNIKSLSAVVNPHTQQIFKITSEWPSGAPQIAPFPEAREEERQLRMKGEHFISLPRFTPRVDFFKALKQLDILSPVSPQQAKQVIAYLVAHSTIRYTDRLVWIIQTRGIDLAGEGYAAQPHSIPVDARNHMRHIVDAETGAWLFSDTTPQPINR